MAHLREVGAELLKYLSRDALTLTDEAEQDVLRSDVVVAELESFTKRQFEDFLRPGRERNVPARCLGALTDDLDNLAPDGFEADSHALEGTSGHSLAFMDQAEENVLRADVVVVE